MEYQILMDSCGDRTEEMKRDERIALVPLRLHIGKEEYMDDGSLDRLALLDAIAQSDEIPRSSCPSPAEYVERVALGCKRVYMITVSEQLSGSFNSASLAAKQMREKLGLQVNVINSHSASAGQTLLAMQIIRWEEGGYSWQEIEKKVPLYLQKMKTRFVLEDLTMLERNGRLTGLKARLADVFHICPVLGGTSKGTICQTGQARGIKRALQMLYRQIVKDSEEWDWHHMVISFCEKENVAIELKTKLKQQFPERSIRLVATGGLSSMYAGRGGIIVAYA